MQNLVFFSPTERGDFMKWILMVHHIRADTVLDHPENSFPQLGAVLSKPQDPPKSNSRDENTDVYDNICKIS